MQISFNKILSWVAIFAAFSFPLFGEEKPSPSTSTQVEQKAKPAAPYKAAMIEEKLFLKFIKDDSKPFGPFEKDRNNGERYVYYPNDRPREFRSAQQIYQSRESGEWLFSDNYIAMRALLVDMSAISRKKKE